MTKYQYTGQFSYKAEFGLYFYCEASRRDNARWYDSQLGRFAQADTVVQNPFYSQSYDRYAYGFNNPVRFIDPTGHLNSDQIRSLFGIAEDNFDDWIAGHKHLFNMLSAAQNGDIVHFSMIINGETVEYHWLIARNEYNDDSAIFVNVDNGNAVNPKDIDLEKVKGIGLYRYNEEDEVYRMQGETIGDISMPEYNLPEGWQQGSNGYTDTLLYLNWANVGLDTAGWGLGTAALFTPSLTLIGVGIYAVEVVRILTTDYVERTVYAYHPGSPPAPPTPVFDPPIP